ncbi:MAG: Hsp70 family protein [Armatimonadetes bacterium]|nr:Hsp70 family protein [Armatimonadota bacterium]
MPKLNAEKAPVECWAIELGTTNTVVARCVGGHASPVELADVCVEEPIEHTPMVPSQVYFDTPEHFHIGARVRAAAELERDLYMGRLTPLARSWKRALAREAPKPVAECGRQSITARQCAAAFLQEVVRLAGEEARSRPGAAGRPGVVARILRLLRREAPIQDLVITVPVESFESYRAELHGIARKLSVRRFRTLDEPVAAALGYGVDLAAPRTLLIVDFGGGTLDIAIVRAGLAPLPGTDGRRRSEVLAARGLEIGGETVDEWLAELACSKAGQVRNEVRGAVRSMAERAKIELSAAALSTDFGEFRVAGMPTVRVTRGEFEALLKEKGLYARIGDVVGAVVDQARSAGGPEIDEVLLVGGSTQLPGVAKLLEGAFGREKVRSWSPFRAVALGAAQFGAGHTVDQIIHHDYAVRLFDHKAQRPEYELLVRRGTRYPAQAGDARYYTLTEGQTEFALPVCEVGLAGRMRLDWKERQNGHRYWTPGPVEEKECVYTLNEGDTLRISPPGVAGQHRLRVEFAVDAERYLCATIHDLKLKRDIRENARLVKLR